MSDKSRDRKDEAQDDQELPEEVLPEEAPPEEPKPEEAKPETALAVQNQPETALAEKDQPETALAAKDRPEKPLAAQTLSAQALAAQAQAIAEQARQKKRQRIILIVLISLAVVGAVTTALILLHNRWFRRPVIPGPGPADSASMPSATVPSVASGRPEATPNINAVQPLAGGERRSEDFFTILIFGMDETSGMTDSIMVASYDVTNQKAAVMSIPRDTLVNDYRSSMINAIYSWNGQGEAGAEALKTEISRLIGFVPDFYITINWELVGKMVDAIGGVYYDVPWHMGYEDPTQDLHIHFEPGYQFLNGEAAMNLVRWRQNNDGIYGGGDGSDIGRLDLHHNFLKAVLRQTLKPQNITRIPELIQLFNDNVVGDLAVENMLWFGEQAVLGGLTPEDVEFVTMPFYGTVNRGGRYYGRVCPIADQLLVIINESLNPYAEDVTLLHLDLIQMSEDGNTLSSTTGILRNPAAGVYTPPEGIDDPYESDPLESDPWGTDPLESDPWATDPLESGPWTTDPTESDPWATDPTESDPWATDPLESGPEPGQTDDPSPEPGPTETLGDGPDDENWGDTPD